jgi:hypothetical protein
MIFTYIILHHYKQLLKLKEEEEENKMVVGISDADDGNKFIIPSCKVISVDKRNTNSLIVDLEYSEAVKYRIFE